MRQNSIVTALILGLVCSLAGLAQETFGWRGNGAGVFSGAVVPTEWAKDKNIVWTTPIPKWGNASPVLAGTKIFVTAEPGTLICINAGDGKILWEIF